MLPAGFRSSQVHLVREGPATEWSFDFGRDGPEDVLVTTSGDATLEGLLAMHREGLEHPEYRPGLLVLVDHRRLNWQTLSSEDLRRRIEAMAADNERTRGTISALVLGKPADYGLARVQQVYAEGELSFELGVFYSMEDARRWLAERARARAVGGTS